MIFPCHDGYVKLLVVRSAPEANKYVLQVIHSMSIHRCDKAVWAFERWRACDCQCTVIEARSWLRWWTYVCWLERMSGCEKLPIICTCRHLSANIRHLKHKSMFDEDNTRNILTWSKRWNLDSKLFEVFCDDVTHFGDSSCKVSVYAEKVKTSSVAAKFAYTLRHNNHNHLSSPSMLLCVWCA